MNNDELIPPSTSKGDVAHSLVKAGLSFLPGTGELFQLVIQPPLERRRQEWMQQVENKLKTIESEGLDLAKLQDDERFLSTVLRASQIALKTHVQEKRKALCNVIANVAQGQSFDEVLENLFLECIDSLTALHIKVLVHCQSSVSASESYSSGHLIDRLKYFTSELKGQDEITNQIWRDLHSRGLVSREYTNSPDPVEDKITTNLGDKFIQFISE